METLQQCADAQTQKREVSLPPKKATGLSDHLTSVTFDENSGFSWNYRANYAKNPPLPNGSLIGIDAMRETEIANLPFKVVQQLGNKAVERYWQVLVHQADESTVDRNGNGRNGHGYPLQNGENRDGHHEDAEKVYADAR